jgi:histidinol-phosphate aminotransferase
VRLPFRFGASAIVGADMRERRFLRVASPLQHAAMTILAPKPWIAAIAPYVPGRATTDSGATAAKLSSNENPLGTAPEARAAYAAAAATLERYPDAGATDLREAIAAHYAIESDRVIHGTGSDEVLHLAAGAFAGPGDEILYVRYGFSVYPIAARRVGATPVEAADSDYATDVDALLAAVTPRTRVVFVANPNNPTGTYTSKAEIARLHAGLPEDCLLVVDQAYTEYLDPQDDDGALELARRCANVLVTRTFSKIFGLAAERIGWGYGSADMIAAMHRIRAPFNVTTGGQAAAIASLAAADFVEASRAHNAKWRGWFEAEIAKLGNVGLRAVPSKANFVLILFEGETTAEAAFAGLMERGFIVRWLPGQGLRHGLRITIGTEEQTRAIVAALRGIVGA